MNKLDVFIKRLSKLNIKIELASNVPWVYLVKINNIKVTDKFQSDYGFTLCYLPIKNDGEFNFSDAKEIFKIIRKYSTK